MWRLRTLSKLSKFLLGITTLSLVVTLWYNSTSPTKDLVTAKLAVKQLEDSDASYLAFAHASSIGTGLYLITAILVIITAIITFKEFKGE